MNDDYFLLLKINYYSFYHFCFYQYGSRGRSKNYTFPLYLELPLALIFLLSGTLLRKKLKLPNLFSFCLKIYSFRSEV